MRKRKTNTQIMSGLLKMFNDNEMVFVSAIVRQICDEYVEQENQRTKEELEAIEMEDPYHRNTYQIAVRVKSFCDDAYSPRRV